MAKTQTPKTQTPGAGDGSQGPLVQATEAQKIAEARKAEREKEAKAKAARFKGAADALLGMAKAYEAEAIGSIIPFKDRTGQEVPAMVLKLEEKQKPGTRELVMTARVLVLSGNAQQPYPANLELPAVDPKKKEA